MTARRRETAPARRPPILALAVFTASLGGFSMGYCNGIIGWASLFVRKELGLTDLDQEALISAGSLSAVLGAVLGGLAADRLGRRGAFLMASALFTAGSVGSGWAGSLEVLVAARGLIGVAIGMVFVCSGLYIAEISPSRWRGRLVTVNALAIALGIFVAYAVEYRLGGASEWRLMLQLGAVPGLLLGALIYRLPESPRWLLSRGREADATEALRRLRSSRDSDAAIDSELAEIARSLRPLETERRLMDPTVRPQLATGLWLALFRSLGGLSVITFYSPTILDLAHFPAATTSALATLGLGSAILLSRLFTMAVVDRRGRRSLLLSSTALVALGFAILAIAFVLPPDTNAAPWTALAGLLVIVTSYNVSSSVVPLLLVEIFPQDVRGRALSLTNGVLWSLDFLVAASFLTLVGALGRPATFGLYAGINLAALVYFQRSVRETTGQTLEQSATSQARD